MMDTDNFIVKMVLMPLKTTIVTLTTEILITIRNSNLWRGLKAVFDKVSYYKIKIISMLYFSDKN